MDSAGQAHIKNGSVSAIVVSITIVTIMSCSLLRINYEHDKNNSSVPNSDRWNYITRCREYDFLIWNKIVNRGPTAKVRLWPQFRVPFSLPTVPVKVAIVCTLVLWSEINSVIHSFIR